MTFCRRTNHGHESRSAGDDGRANLLEADLLVQRQTFLDTGNEQVGGAGLLRMEVENPDQAGEDDTVAAVVFDGQQANFERAGAGTFKDTGVVEATGDGEGRFAVQADHADDLTFVGGDEVDVLVVEFVDQPTVPGVGVLRNLTHERPVVQRA